MKTVTPDGRLKASFVREGKKGGVCGNFFSSGISNPMGEEQSEVGAWELGGLAASRGEE